MKMIGHHMTFVLNGSIEIFFLRSIGTRGEIGGMQRYSMVPYIPMGTTAPYSFYIAVVWPRAWALTAHYRGKVMCSPCRGMTLFLKFGVSVVHDHLQTTTPLPTLYRPVQNIKRIKITVLSCVYILLCGRIKYSGNKMAIFCVWQILRRYRFHTVYSMPWKSALNLH